MMVPLAIVCLIVLLIISAILFFSELKYRRRISTCGVLTFFCTSFLVWHIADSSIQVKNLAIELAKYKPVSVGSVKLSD